MVMFGFSKKTAKISKSQELVAKATALELLEELNSTLLEEKETKNLLSQEKEKHEVFKEIGAIQKRRDQNMKSIRKVWEEAKTNGYSPKHLWDSHLLFEEDRLSLASEFEAYYGFETSQED